MAVPSLKEVKLYTRTDPDTQHSQVCMRAWAEQLQRPIASSASLEKCPILLSKPFLPLWRLRSFISQLLGIMFTALETEQHSPLPAC